MKRGWIKTLSILLSGALIVLATPVNSQAAGRKPSLSKTKMSLIEGKKGKLSVKNKRGYTVTWKSNKKSIVTVSDTGAIKAKKKGSAKITAVVKSKKTGKVFPLFCHVAVHKRSAKTDDSQEKVSDAATSSLNTAEPAGSTIPSDAAEPVSPTAPSIATEPASSPAPPCVTEPVKTALPSGTSGCVLKEPINGPSGVEVLFSCSNVGCEQEVIKDDMIYSYEQLQALIQDTKKVVELNVYTSYNLIRMIERWEEIDQDFFDSNVLYVGRVGSDARGRGYGYTVFDVLHTESSQGEKQLEILLHRYWAVPEGQLVTADLAYYSGCIRIPKEIAQGCEAVNCIVLGDLAAPLPTDPPDQSVVEPDKLVVGSSGEKGIEGEAYLYESDSFHLKNQVVSDYKTLQNIIQESVVSTDIIPLIDHLASYNEEYFKENSLVLGSYEKTCGYQIKVHSLTVKEEKDGTRFLSCNLFEQWEVADDLCVPCVMLNHNFMIEVPSEKVTSSDKVLVHSELVIPE